jgi:hypothetical protein
VRAREEVREDGIVAGAEVALELRSLEEAPLIDEHVAQRLGGAAVPALRERREHLGRLLEHPSAPVVLRELPLHLRALIGEEPGPQEHVLVEPDRVGEVAGAPEERAEREVGLEGLRAPEPSRVGERLYRGVRVVGEDVAHAGEVGPGLHAPPVQPLAQHERHHEEAQDAEDEPVHRA